MKLLDKMNDALDYVEKNLLTEIDIEEAARRACCSVFNFQRMFSFIADVSLADYIRRRRLSLAAWPPGPLRERRQGRLRLFHRDSLDQAYPRGAVRTRDPGDDLRRV